MADVTLFTNDGGSVPGFPIHLTDSISALAKTTPTTLVEYLIAGETIFPSGYDIAAVVGDGITMRERSLSDNWLGLLANNYVVSGFVFPATSISLSLTVPLGVAFIAGRYLGIPATALTFSPSTTSWVFLKVTRDASLNVTGAWYEVNTTGTFPSADYIPMGKVVSAIGSITSVQQDPVVHTTSPLPTGPVGIGAGSTQAHEGTVTIAADQAMSGVHFYTDFTLNSGKTLTIADGAGRLCIMATGTITINGIIDGIGAGGQGAPGTYVSGAGFDGGDGTAQPGGGGGAATVAGASGGDGGRIPGANPGRGGRGASAAATQGTNNTGELVGTASPLGIYGGSGGGGGGGGTGGTGALGGNGGGSIILCAPTVILANTATLKTSGADGQTGSAGNGGGGGGGGAGNVYVFCRSYTDNGATFTQAAGAGGPGTGAGAGGAAGRAGVKQILIY